MSVNVPSDVKHSTQPLTSTFSARSYALRMICSLFTGKSFLFGLSKLRLATCRVCICVATSRRLFSKPSWIRFSRINDGVSKTFPLFVGHFRDAGRQHRSARKFANCRNIGQLNYAWLFPSSTLILDIRLPCV